MGNFREYLIAHIHVILLWILFAFSPANAPELMSPHLLFCHRNARWTLLPNPLVLPIGVK